MYRHYVFFSYCVFPTQPNPSGANTQPLVIPSTIPTHAPTVLIVSTPSAARQRVVATSIPATSPTKLQMVVDTTLPAISSATRQRVVTTPLPATPPATRQRVVASIPATPRSQRTATPDFLLDLLERVRNDHSPTAAPLRPAWDPNVLANADSSDGPNPSPKPLMKNLALLGPHCGK